MIVRSSEIPIVSFNLLLLLFVLAILFVTTPAFSAANGSQAEFETQLRQMRRLLERGATEKVRTDGWMLTVQAKRALGADSPVVADIMETFAKALLQGNDHEKKLAQSYFEKVIAIRTKNNMGSSGQVGAEIVKLARLKISQLDYDGAETLLKKTLTAYEVDPKVDPNTLADLLNEYAILQRSRGQYEKALFFYKKALSARERNLGANHPKVAVSLNNLANLYREIGDGETAYHLYQRALTIQEKHFGKEHGGVALTLNNMGTLSWTQKEYSTARRYFERALSIWETTAKDKQADFALGLSNYAALLFEIGENQEARKQMQKALAIRTATLGSSHPEIASSLNNLAAMFSAEGATDKALQLIKKAKAINQKVFGADHPRVAFSYYNLAILLNNQHQTDAALKAICKASQITQKRLLNSTRGNSATLQQEISKARNVFFQHVRVLHRIIRKVENKARLTDEACSIMQIARSNAAARTLNRVAARYALHNNALVALLRKRQNGLDTLQKLEQQQTAILSGTNKSRKLEEEKGLVTKIFNVKHQLQVMDQTIKQRFPRYFELANQQASSLNEVKRWLHNDEALLAYFVGEDETFACVIRHKQAALQQFDIGRNKLDRVVKRLRRRLMPNKRSSRIQPFPGKLAHDLYQQIFAPLTSKLKGVQHLMIVPDAALQSLPFAVLITKPTADTEIENYVDIPWLGFKYPMTTLPSIGSLPALRSLAKHAKSTKPFIGFGDPILFGDFATERDFKAANLFSRGMVANAEKVRLLMRLPDTAEELKAIAKSLSVDNSTVYLQGRASETNVKRLNLADYKVITFSTHGLMANEFAEVAEPALVLTPPEKGTQLDDGLLSAGEIARLKLDADWVVLSACNTAASDGTPGAEGLSGLARAFFHAGSRALMVSHWSVESKSAAFLIQTTFANLAKHPKQRRAVAVQSAMKALMNDKPMYAHPMFWAPFVVVGEGGLL